MKNKKEHKKPDFIIKNFNLKPLVSKEEGEVIKEFFDSHPFLKQEDAKKDFNNPSFQEDLSISNFINNESEIYQKAWIQTYSGRKFYPLNPDIDLICLEDFSKALSNQCRFSGHTKEFYSVAQHSVMVSYLCDTNDQLHGLLHDVSEAYMVDLPTPIKRLNEFNFFKKIENKLQKIIYKKFNLSETEPNSVKKADLLMLSTEARDLMSPLHPEFKLPCLPLPMKIDPLLPKQAEELFLNRFYQLINGSR